MSGERWISALGTDGSGLDGAGALGEMKYEEHLEGSKAGTGDERPWRRLKGMSLQLAGKAPLSSRRGHGCTISRCYEYASTSSSCDIIYLYFTAFSAYLKQPGTRGTRNATDTERELVQGGIMDKR